MRPQLAMKRKMSNIFQIVAAIIGSTGIVGLIQFLIARRDNKKSMLVKIDKKLDKVEKDNCRTQLLLMLSDYTDSTSEIMILAEHYFKDLKGDWYVSSLFKTWLKKQHIESPFWFDN